MSNTTTITPGATQSGRKKNYGAAAAVATGVAGVGAAAAIYSNLDDISEIEEIAEIEEPIAEPPTSEEPAAGTAAQTTSHTEAPQQPAAQPAANADPVQQQPAQQPTQTEPAQQPTQQPTQQQPAQTEPAQPTQVNPDDVADAIIAEVMIDPDDIDMADIVEFDDIVEVYTVDGENFTAATFHTADGTDMMMVDLDDDDVFDIITTPEGIPYVDEYGNFLSADNMTVDDVEMDITGNNTYMAHHQGENTHEFGMESISEDILTT